MKIKFHLKLKTLNHFLNMNYKNIFVFGLLIASSLAKAFLPKNKFISSSAKVILDFGDNLICKDENFLNADNGVASGIKTHINYI